MGEHWSLIDAHVLLVT